MPTLEYAQSNFIATINHGPDALDQSLFAGPIDRVLLGLKAHANTVSHARLVALEETFPLTRAEMGEQLFNQLSRQYTESAQARASDNNAIGQYFGTFLATHSVDAALCDLATIEWAWLESYHAPDATPLHSSELAGLDEATLLAIAVSPHPSLRLVQTTAPLADALDVLAGQMPAAIATLRADTDVRLLPLDALEYVLALQLYKNNCTLGNLIGLALEQAGDRAPLEPILTLIGAGALVGFGIIGAE